MKNSKIFSSVALVICLTFISFCFLPFFTSVHVTAAEPAQNTQQPLNQEYQPLTVKFIDVGQGDSALLQCGDEAMLIDGGNPDDAQKLYSILKTNEITKLKAIIITHAHEDHCGSIAAALTAASAEIVYAPVDQDNSDVFTDITKKTAITIPEAGTTFTLGTATVEIIAPISQYDDENNGSIVCKVTNGEDTFLFTGDIERAAELDLLDKKIDLSADVLKVAHHGSNDSTSYIFLREIMPKYAVISCGKDNPYGHPHEEVLSRLNDAETIVYRTDQQGDITAVSTGKGIEFKTQSAAENNEQTNVATQETTLQYIGNKNSKVFHISSCKTLPKEKNRVYLDSRQEAVEAGFRPCGNCQP